VLSAHVRTMLYEVRFQQLDGKQGARWGIIFSTACRPSAMDCAGREMGLSIASSLDVQSSENWSRSPIDISKVDSILLSAKPRFC
jgi:hypothetical protein